MKYVEVPGCVDHRATAKLAGCSIRPCTLTGIISK